jgi:N-acetylglucosamine kinase-like BadF-type ATPase
MASCVLAIDGGQTTTTAVVCDSQGRLLGVGRAGPANHVWEKGGVARARRAVRTSIGRALRAAGLPDTTFRAAFLGVTGGDDRTRRAVEGCVKARHFRLANDKVSALACVTAGEPGVVVIAGTGTITYGENAGGETATVSGWGYLLGDEGGGFWIARAAVAAACRAQDGRLAPTALTPLLLEAAGVEGLWDLHTLVYSHQLSRAGFAALAAVVPDAARQGDAAARRILRAAGRELGLAAVVALRELRLHSRAVTVGMVGGVFLGSALVRSSFRRQVQRQAPRAVFALPRFAPVIGSALLALKMIDVPITATVMAHLDAASEVIGAK